MTHQNVPVSKAPEISLTHNEYYPKTCAEGEVTTGQRCKQLQLLSHFIRRDTPGRVFLNRRQCAVEVQEQGYRATGERCTQTADGLPRLEAKRGPGPFPRSLIPLHLVDAGAPEQ